MRKKTKHKKESNDSEYDYESKSGKVGGYVFLICTLSIFAIGLYLTIIGGSTSGISQNRTGVGGSEQTLTGPMILFISAIPMFLLIRMALKKLFEKLKKN